MHGEHLPTSHLAIRGQIFLDSSPVFTFPALPRRPSIHRAVGMGSQRKALNWQPQPSVMLYYAWGTPPNLSSCHPRTNIFGLLAGLHLSRPTPKAIDPPGGRYGKSAEGSELATSTLSHATLCLGNTSQPLILPSENKYFWTPHRSSPFRPTPKAIDPPGGRYGKSAEGSELATSTLSHAILCLGNTSQPLILPSEDKYFWTPRRSSLFRPTPKAIDPPGGRYGKSAEGSELATSTLSHAILCLGNTSQPLILPSEDKYFWTPRRSSPFRPTPKAIDPPGGRYGKSAEGSELATSTLSHAILCMGKT